MDKSTFFCLPTSACVYVCFCGRSRVCVLDCVLVCIVRVCVVFFVFAWMIEVMCVFVWVVIISLGVCE